MGNWVWVYIIKNWTKELVNKKRKLWSFKITRTSTEKGHGILMQNLRGRERYDKKGREKDILYW